MSTSNELPGAQETHSEPRTTWPTGQVKSAEMDKVAGSKMVVGSESVTTKSLFSKMMDSKSRSMVDFSCVLMLVTGSPSAGKLISKS